MPSQDLLDLPAQLAHLAEIAVCLPILSPDEETLGALTLEGGFPGLRVALTHLQPRTLLLAVWRLEEADFSSGVLPSAVQGTRYESLDALHRPLRAYRTRLGEPMLAEVCFSSEGLLFRSELEAPWRAGYLLERHLALERHQEAQFELEQAQATQAAGALAAEYAHWAARLLADLPFLRAARLKKTALGDLERLAIRVVGGMDLEHHSLRTLVRQVVADLRLGLLEDPE